MIGTSERNLFGIKHYAGGCSYDITNFIEKDLDLLDSAFVMLLSNSSDGFMSKFVSSPSLAAERHSKDKGILVQAQVSSRPPALLPILPSLMAQHLEQAKNTHISMRPT